MITLILYTTAGCHLCELANEILQSLAQQHPLNIIHTEIGDDDALVEQYGVSIPVVKFPDNTEINWPFGRHDIEIKLSQ